MAKREIGRAKRTVNETRRNKCITHKVKVIKSKREIKHGF